MTGLQPMNPVNDNSLLAARNANGVGTTRALASLVKIEHSIFSAPFVILAMLLAADGIPSARTVFLILVALLAARTAAMSFNRIVDLRYDRANPRTAMRELVTGAVTPTKAIALVTGSSIIFVITAFALNTLCGSLAAPTLILILGYSFTKRFTAASHFILGLSLAVSPGAAWLAVGAPVSSTPILLGLIVVLWVMGFDILYSLADIEFDRRSGLYSIPARLGARNSLYISRILHTGCLVGMIALYFLLQFPLWAFIGLTPVAALFIRQHALVQPDDFSRLNAAFFTMNGWIGILFAAITSVIYFVTR